MDTGTLTSRKSFALTSEIFALEEKISHQAKELSGAYMKVAAMAIEVKDKAHWLGCRTKQLTTADNDGIKAWAEVREMRKLNKAQREANAGHLETNIALQADTKNLHEDLACVERCSVRQQLTIRELQAERATAKNRIVAYGNSVKRLSANEIKLVEKGKCYKAQVRAHQNTIDEQRNCLIKIRADLKDAENVVGQLTDGIEELHIENEKLADVGFPGFNVFASTGRDVSILGATTSVRLEPLNVAFGHGQGDMELLASSERARRKVASKLAAKVYAAVYENLTETFT